MNTVQTVYTSHIAVPTAAAKTKDIYTCPSKTKGILRSLVCCEYGAAGDTYKVYLRKAGVAAANTNLVVPATVVAANKSEILTFDLGLEE